jgi:hypothetical protein
VFSAGTAVREDQFIIHVGVNGVQLPTTFSWTSKEGGDITTESVYSRPGGQMPGIQLGGPGSRSDCTVKRHYTSNIDSYVTALENACGNAAMWVSWTPIDGNQNPNGDTHLLTGIIKEVMVPQYDANASGAGFLTLVMACDQQDSQSSNKTSNSPVFAAGSTDAS